MRDVLLAVLLAGAFGMVARGAWLAWEPAGWVVGGLLLAFWSVLALTDRPGGDV